MKLYISTNNKKYQFNYEHKIVTDGKKYIDDYRVWRGKIDLRGKDINKLINELEKKLE
jgi:hypothetical protein